MTPDPEDEPVDADPDEPVGPGPGEPVELPIDGTLDLHTFQPREVREAVSAYLDACRERNILEVRIIHGKGMGALRRTVQALLPRLPHVVRYRTAGEDAGGWGATLVTLLPPDDGPSIG